MNGLNNQAVTSKNYDEWCHLVKLCFDSESENSDVSVSMIELMRLHPVLNKMSFYGVRDLIKNCHLVKLRPNQLLYRQDETFDSVYIVIFGKLVLHHKTLGALGVIGMGQTLGEETLVERVLNPKPNNKTQANKKDAVYSQCESYLLEFGEPDFKRIRDLILRGGSKSDYFHLTRLLTHNYSQKAVWRGYKQRAYI